jgi:hypothetical protein
MIPQKAQQTSSPVAHDERVRGQLRSLLNALVSVQLRKKPLTPASNLPPPTPPPPINPQTRALACKSNRYAVSESKASLGAGLLGAGADGRGAAEAARSSVSAVR